MASSAIWARAALTSSALVFACPARPHPPSGASVSSTQVRSARVGSPAAAATTSVSWQVAAEGSQREAGSCRGRQPAADDGPATGGQHGQPEAEGGDQLQQEQPADHQDGPASGQVQVQMDRPGGDQQAGTRYPHHDCPPARSRRFRVFLSGSRGCRYLCLSGRRFPPCHRVSPFCRGAGLPRLGRRPAQYP